MEKLLADDIRKKLRKKICICDIYRYIFIGVQNDTAIFNID